MIQNQDLPLNAKHSLGDQRPECFMGPLAYGLLRNRERGRGWGTRPKILNWIPLIETDR